MQVAYRLGGLFNGCKARERPPEERQMSDIARRTLLKSVALGALAFTVDGTQMLLSPRQARAQNAAFKTLEPAQIETIEAVGETLVPGARDAGLSHFIDQQISGPSEEALLEARILNVRPPYANFYRAALRAVDGASRTQYAGRPFAQLTETECVDFIDAMRQNKASGWQGPPGPFVYLILRSDAVDVVYGTMDGYSKLGIPYMPHIAPEKRW
jgi:Gluconate 2-dehydrogenase subunit 3